jgi:BirA family biotin operon repressor/biotin-[acetyl-CoA-carboxylase] ligase
LIEFLTNTGSTNADLAARLRGGDRLPEGHWLVADRQTAGRGRQGREWFDGAGNFMGSTVVHCQFGDPAPGTLALLTGLALVEIVAPLIGARAQAELKWPNDVMIGRAKLAGILLEQVGGAVVVGVGVNLVAAPQLPDRETVALSAFKPPPPRDVFAEALAGQFQIEVHRWRTFGLEAIRNRWLAAAHPIGTPLQTGEAGNPALIGTFAGLSSDGALQLRLADGTTRNIHAGEVHFAAP